jgi:hypothetical protein
MSWRKSVFLNISTGPLAPLLEDELELLDDDELELVEDDELELLDEELELEEELELLEDEELELLEDDELLLEDDELELAPSNVTTRIRCTSNSSLFSVSRTSMEFVMPGVSEIGIGPSSEPAGRGLAAKVVVSV